MATFDLTTPEQWYPIPGYEGYEISSRFRVRSWWKRPKQGDSRRGSPCLRSVILGKNGYLIFYTRINGRQRIVYVHHVVASIAHGPRPPGMQVLHRDDDEFNNHPGNLYYGTPLQNAKDSARNGKHPRGETRSDAKLSESQAKDVLRRAMAGENQRVIAREYGIGQQLVSRIKVGLAWTHIRTHIEDSDVTDALEGKGGQ